MTDPAYLDTETRSRNNISRGTDAYFDGDSACLIVTWVPPGSNEAGIWDRFASGVIPWELADILNNPSIPIVAHSAVHDRTALLRCCGIHTAMGRWRCTRAQSYAHGFPGALDTLCALAGLGEDDAKLRGGKNLIQIFCIPRADGGWNTPATHPLEWAEFCKYAKRDTTSLRRVHQWLPSHNYGGTNLATFTLDQWINERGFAYDVALAEAAVKLLEKAKTASDREIYVGTRGAVTAATQRAKLLAYLNEKHSAELANLRAATIRDVLEADDLNPEVRFLLETRLEAAKSSGSKYKRGLSVRGRGDRIRHAHQFNGAGRTGRTAHKGFQPGNTARPSKWTLKSKIIEQTILPAIMSGRALLPEFALALCGPNEACANAVRSAIIANPGNELVIADWSNIESRILAWIAGEDWKLEAYRAVDRGEGVDLYRMLVHRFFGIPLSEIDDHLRQVGKVIELACGFGGSVGAFVTMSANYGMDLATLPPMVLPVAKPEHLKKADKAWRRAFLKGEDYGLERDVFMACHVLVQAYRESNKSINQMRHDLDRAVKTAVKEPGTSFQVAKCLVWCNGSFLIIQLPSGRRLLYAQPRMHQEKDVDPESGKETIREYLSYLTARGKGWLRERAWAGLFVENIVQAIANDILRDALRAVHADTLNVPAIVAYLATLPEYERTAICLHVHDEIALDLPPGLYALARLIQTMVGASPWARGLPLAADGRVGPRYSKKG